MVAAGGLRPVTVVNEIPKADRRALAHFTRGFERIIGRRGVGMVLDWRERGMELWLAAALCIAAAIGCVDCVIADRCGKKKSLSALALIFVGGMD